jgi:exopolysaccharide biosynthesis polyprenyl glycosylphosphotransferase
LVFGVGEHRLVIIGSDNTTEALAELFASDHRLGFHVTGRFETFDEKTASQIRALKTSHGVDEIILGDATVDRDTALDILTFTDVNHLGFKYASDLFAAAAGRSVVHMFAGIPVIEVKKTPLDGWGAIYKRVFDIVCSFLLIVLTAPIQLIVALAVYIEQPGSVLYARTSDGKKAMRMGQGSEPFHYYKFRSMKKDTHAKQYDPEFLKQHGNERDGSPLFKLKDDPRVTPVGRIIRRYHLDELPELYLVLAGHMSLVGPRPHLPEEVANYQPHHRKVMTIKPGITGLAQISGNSELDFEEEVRLDTYYIEHWSPWLDLVTLLKTPAAALRGKTK